MRVLKKFFLLFTILTSLVVMKTLTKVSASSNTQNTAWTLSFEKGEVINLNDSTNNFNIVSNGFSVTYNDLTGVSQGGYLEIFIESVHMEGIQPIKLDDFVNGQTRSYNLGGRIFIRAFHKEYGVEIQDAQFYSFFVDRSVVTSNRISTNYQAGKYYYDHEVSFKDIDFIRDYDRDLILEAKNLLTNEMIPNDLYYGVVLDKNGIYEVSIKDKRKNESIKYTLAIDKENPFIELYEWNWMVETEVSSGAVISTGMKVAYKDSIQVSSMVYEYRPFVGRTEYGTMPSGQIFWRKGHYTITVTDMVGNVYASTFIITDYDLITDPASGVTVGTEVTHNGGANGGSTMHVGFTRCIYLGATSPSQSRLDFNFTSSDETVATISAYGTITAKRAGTTIITSVNKKDGKVGKIIITVLK